MVCKIYLDNDSSTTVILRVVSVQKARRILGTLANTMSDNQVKDIIYYLHLLAKEQLVYNGSKHGTNK